MSNGDLEQDGNNDLEAGFDDLAPKSRTLGDLWRENQMVKLGVVLGSVILVGGGIVLFGGSDAAQKKSLVTSAPDVKELPGTKELSPEMKEAMEASNEKMLEDAIKTGESAIPTPIEPPKGKVAIKNEEVEPEDPLERWRKMQEERVRLQKEQQAQAVPVPDQAAGPDPNLERQKAIEALAGAMSGQMTQVLKAREIKGMESLQVTAADFLEKRKEAAEAKAKADLVEQRAAADAAGQSAPAADVLVPAATIEYAQLLTEANTDAPGPILAQIVSGPLAGSRMIGSFSATDEFLILKFNVVVKDGQSIGIDAIALDPETTLGGIVTDIDHRYFTRIILPAAASFVEGFGSAVAESGSTTVTVDGGAAVQSQNDLNPREELFKGVEEAAGKMSEIISEEADKTEPMLKVAAGTPMGILFLQPVLKPVAGAPQPGQPGYYPPGQQPPFGYYGQGPYVVGPGGVVPVYGADQGTGQPTTAPGAPTYAPVYPGQPYYPGAPYAGPVQQTGPQYSATVGNGTATAETTQ